MKKIFNFILLCSFFFIPFVSCKKTKSLSELRHEERVAIQQYILDNDIQVLFEFPSDTVFQDKQFYLSPTGLYIHVNKKGDGGKAKLGDIIVARFYEFGLNGDTTIRAMTPQEETNGIEYKYEAGQACQGFLEAFTYIQHEGEVEMIIPSSLGFAKAAQLTITPYRYQLNIKIK